VTKWIIEAWDPKSTFESLEDTGDSSFAALDLKLAAGIQRVLKGVGAKSNDVREAISLRMNELGKSGRILSGRQQAYLVLNSFRAADNSELVFGFDHLASLSVVKGNLFEFKIQWDHILENMSTPIAPSNLQDAFYRKLLGVEDLKEDLNRYDRMPIGDANKTNEWLHKAVDSAIVIRRQRKNQEVWESLIKGASSGHAMAAEILGTSKDNKQAKGKAKSEGRGNGKSGGTSEAAAPAVPKAGGVAKASAKAKPDSGSTSSPSADAIARAKAQAKVPCRVFHANKTCRYGDKCRYMHEPKSAEDRKAVAKAAQKRSASTDSRRSQNDTTVVRACVS
jgi:hypothetical protein